jgi:peroxiredoxin
MVAFLLVSEVLCAQDVRLGTQVSDFTVRDMSDRAVKYAPVKARVTVVMFFSTRCPISNAFNYRRNALFADFKEQVNFFVVDTNSNESLEEVRQYAKDVGFDFPVYVDVNNRVADQFGANITTDTFVIDSSGVLRYRGYMEDSPNAARATRQALRLAIEDVLAGRQVEVNETKALGCSIRRANP